MFCKGGLSAIFLAFIACATLALFVGTGARPTAAVAARAVAARTVVDQALVEGAEAPALTPTVAQVAPTPTMDRLAPPPTVENPTQADEGAHVYWLNCQPCHGDRGQGLTEEWRAQYPPEDQNCWASGCHGDRPYENGFTLPADVPPVTGPESLERFEHMGAVLSYMRAAMPFNAPGSLEEEEYLAIAAFLAREHGVWNGSPVREDTAASLRLRPAAPATPTLATEQTAAGPPPTPPADRAWNLWVLIAPALLVVLLLIVGLWRWRRA